MPSETESDSGEIHWEPGPLNVWGQPAPPAAPYGIAPPNDPYPGEPLLVNDRVALMANAPWPASSGDPQWGSLHACFGTIIAITPGSSEPYRVRWDNGHELCYPGYLVRVGRDHILNAGMAMPTMVMTSFGPGVNFNLGTLLIFNQAGQIIEGFRPDITEGYRYRREFDGWRIVEPDEVLVAGDTWLGRDKVGPPNPNPINLFNSLAGNTYNAVRSQQGSSGVIEDGTIYRKHYTSRRIPMNPHFSKPLPLP